MYGNAQKLAFSCDTSLMDYFQHLKSIKFTSIWGLTVVHLHNGILVNSKKKCIIGKQDMQMNMYKKILCII